MSVKDNLRQHAKNWIGKSFSTPYLIIESDDWGSIRMPSMEAYERLKNKSVDLGKGESGRYNLYDNLANKTDFEALFELLTKHRDHRGNHPIITAVSLTANPDFDKIKEADYEAYFYEPFPITLDKYGFKDALGYWREGKEKRLFVPQFHAREHLNVPVWLRMLRKKDPATLFGFEEGCWGFRTKTPFNISYQASFDVEKPEDVEYHAASIRSGLQLFKEIHGYQADFIVPPNGPFSRALETVLFEEGVKYIGASKVQKEPLGASKTKKHLHWLGKKNRNGQYFLTRNAFFEPNATGKDWVRSCLNDIQYAFRWNKPAVISSHRTNYIGSHDERNRTHGLQQLDQLLAEVIKRWPKVEFITSSELGNKISVIDKK